ncbi:MAG: 3-hydroxyacyl-ACP dehydratase FabZ family protein [Pirellulales bacterium]
MPAKDLLFDLNTLDPNHVAADLEAIRRVNAQRFEMEQLTAISLIDMERKVCIGYKDVGPNEFWVRGHMPGRPLMPGVVMLEAAAQLASYFSFQFLDLTREKSIIGFGGLDEVKFRDPVFPGDRLYLICKMERMRPGKMFVCRFQGVVQGEIAVEGVLKGVAIPESALSAHARGSVASP